MIDSKRLLSDCKGLVQTLEVDLRDRVDHSPELRAEFAREHSEAVAAGRTRRTLEEWERERTTQGAVAWVLGCVFVRFLEDTGLVETPRLGGSGDRLRHSREQQAHFFREHPALTAREYLLDTFRSVAALPGCAGLFDEATNPLFVLPISGDAASELVERWRAIEPESGQLVHDFSDATRSTRFLGDLYQDLSQAAKKQYALLQTPVFVEEFILDRTLEPAIDEFGLAEVRLIDPACGSGHFLLGAFARLLEHWSEREPGTDVRTLVERSLEAVSGVDLNPFAAEIARFRLLVAAVHACGVPRLRDAPDLRPEIAVGDALLHGTRPGQLFADVGLASAATRHLYVTEEGAAIARILERRYHVVVANPPYITPKDPALNEAYRRRFSACSGKYALSVPFTQLLFDLALLPENGHGSGYVGEITSNSFMKREFGRRLIEEHLARLDLTAIVDTSGAYIPGHGTPTVILIGRNRAPVASTIRTVMGIQGEPSTPGDPASGVVWTAILDQVDQPGSQSAFVSVEDVDRVRFTTHPWSIGGGGSSDLRSHLEFQRPGLPPVWWTSAD